MPSILLGQTDTKGLPGACSTSSRGERPVMLTQHPGLCPPWLVTLVATVCESSSSALQPLQECLSCAFLITCGCACETASPACAAAFLQGGLWFTLSGLGGNAHLSCLHLLSWARRVRNSRWCNPMLCLLLPHSAQLFQGVVHV